MTDSENISNYFEKKSKGLFKKLKVKIKNWLGWLGVPLIIPYRGYGSVSTGQIFITGALVEDKGLVKPDEKNSWFENILAMLKRYSSDQISGAKISVQFQKERKVVSTKETGLFKASLPFSNVSSNILTEWIEYHATLNELSNTSDVNYYGKGEILIPGKDAKFGIISDIDDTIMVSHSTQMLRKLRLMLTRNSRTRKPFPGVEEFYRALHKGAEGTDANPFFYISSSEWNLYDLIDDFCSFNEFPKGVYLLREINPALFKIWKQGGKNHEHKYEKIMHLFQTYPDMSFVLVGDNGQHDPEIYSRVARKFPKRIKAIYIRTVKSQKSKQMIALISEMEKINVQMVFSPDTINAAQHAQSKNLIAKWAVEGVIKNSLKD